MANNSCTLWLSVYRGEHFLDFNNIRLEPGERPDDLYERPLSFIDDNLLTASGNIRHHSEDVTTDEELTPSLVIVLTWLRLIHADLPALVNSDLKQALFYDGNARKKRREKLGRD